MQKPHHIERWRCWISDFKQAVERLESYYLLMGEWQRLLDVLLHKESKQTDAAERVETLLRAAEIARRL